VKVSSQDLDMDDKNEASLVNSSSSSRCVYFNKCPEGSSSSQLLWRLNIVMACANKEPQHWVTRGQSMEDDYRVIQRIGKGSYGAVWEVTNKTTGKQFACKLMFKKKMHNIHHEARVLAHLGNHPNVTKLVDIYEDKDCLYLIMELCKGGTLLDYVHRSNYIPERDLATICFQITSALLLFKERGLVHADLKLENTLLVSPTELSIKVADFGLSHFCKEGTTIYLSIFSQQYLAFVS
jgi:calcium-dependent protein kinase